MKMAERLTVLCALLLVHMLLSAPFEFFSVFWRRAGLPSGNINASSASTPKQPAPGSAPGLSTNYASLFLGATVVLVVPSSCHGGSALISDSVDKYMLCPCDAPRKQFTVQLIRDVEVRSVMLRNAEHFSSGVRNFTLLGSRQYPTASWVVLGHFEAEQRRGRQYFDVPPRSRVRFVRLQWATSHGVEPWCTITSFQVYGIDVLETLTRYDEDDEMATGSAGASEAAPDDWRLPPLPVSLTDIADSPPAASAGAGTVSTTVSIDELAVGMWAATGAARSVEEDRLLLPHEDSPLPSEPLAVPVATEARRTAVPSHAAKSTAPPPAATPATALVAASPSWSSCTAVNPVMWNASLQCLGTELASLGGPCALAECEAELPPTQPSVLSAGRHTGSSGGSRATASKSLYQSAATSLLTQLLRQQRTTQQELAALMQRERYLAVELNLTRRMLGDFYSKYRDTVREVVEYRDRLRGVQVELQLLHERLLLREVGSGDGRGDSGGGADGGASGQWVRNDTALAVAAFGLSVFAVALVLVSASSSSQRVIGSTGGWGRQYGLSTGGINTAGGVVGGGGGGGGARGGSGSPVTARQPRGRPR